MPSIDLPVQALLLAAQLHLSVHQLPQPAVVSVDRPPRQAAALAARDVEPAETQQEARDSLWVRNADRLPELPRERARRADPLELGRVGSREQRWRTEGPQAGLDRAESVGVVREQRLLSGRGRRARQR